MPAPAVPSTRAAVNKQKQIKPRLGRKRFAQVGFLSPLPGLGMIWRRYPRFHRGLLSGAPPALGESFAEARV